MQKAAFLIENYLFDQVEINLENYQSGKLEVYFIPRGIFDASQKSFELIFEVKVKDENDNQFVRVRCKGVFRFEEVSSFEDIPEFFYRNSIAILFPYVRAYISLVTTQANVKGIILPTLNLSGLEKELREYTITKNNS